MSLETNKKKYSRLLMVAIFATGLSGIVAEYTLATLATYFLGDSVFQWTIILSIMLFAMGFGSRISKYIEKNILESFIAIEFLLSLLTAGCVMITYSTAALTDHTNLIIYSFSILIGLLIGMEIPLVTRINNHYEDLKTNISSVMEKDYYGSLIGGLFFAFIGLKYLHLTYTPFLMGGINFTVAIILYVKLKKLVKPEFIWKLNTFCSFSGVLLIAGLYYVEPIVIFGEQSRYEDKVVFSKQTKYQQITVTEWQNTYTLYLNNSKQLSTFDEWLYHEPLVHPAIGITKGPIDVLIMGAGDGCAIREALKHERVNSITLVDLDPDMTDVGANHPIFKELNHSAFQHPKVKVINADAFNYLKDTQDKFDVMIVDFPDPRTVELNRLYTKEFYRICEKKLRPNGSIITQAGSPYYATRAFKTIEHTMQAAGFNTLPIHNQVLSLGQWGWILAHKKMDTEAIKTSLWNMDLEGLDTKWLNEEALLHISSFGKDLILLDTTDLSVNSIHNPVLYQYYEAGNWSIY